MDRSRQLKSGILMATTIAVGALVFLLSLWAVQFQTRHQFLVRGLEQSWQAELAAQAGLERAMRNLKRGTPVSPSERLGSALVTVEEVDPGRPRPEGVLHLRCRATQNRMVAVEEALVRAPRVLFTEEFDGDADGWAPLAVVGLGYYILDFNLGATYSLAGDPNWDDYVAEFEALLSKGTGLGVLVRATPQGAGYEGYRVRWTALPPSVTLTRVTQRGEVLLARRNTPLLDLNLRHHYRVRVHQDQIEVEVDGAQVMEVTDPDPLARGSVGVEPAPGGVVLLDRVEVRSEFEVLSRWRP